ncbi:aspartic proteinase CDR1-like [Capsicum chacoense]
MELNICLLYIYHHSPKSVAMEINANLIPTLILLSFFHLSFVCRHKSVNGFTLDLIHNDSPRSPFHNPSSTPYERFQNAFHRSLSRASFFNKIGVNSIQSTVIPTRGEFLMKISVGTPPVDTLVIVDTGSDLTWTQCEPCVKCFKQVIPIFNPKSSSSYKTVSCTDKLCREVSKPIKCTKNVYLLLLLVKMFQFLTLCLVVDIKNAGTFNNATSGIIRLGGGNVSIVNQMHQEIKGKFSYCLIPSEITSTNPNVTSHINFGDNAVVSGPGVVSTPLFKNLLQPTFYLLNLKAVSVGNNTVKYQSSPISPPTGDSGQGNIIIDSGTTLTLIPDAFYLNLGSLLMRSVNANRKDDPSGTFTVCYEPNENGTINVPKIVAHFTGADLELSPTSVFSKVADDLVCLTIVPGNQVAIFGNLLQSNFLIGYDLVANKVSFKPTDCTKQ